MAVTDAVGGRQNRTVRFAPRSSVDATPEV